MAYFDRLSLNVEVKVKKDHLFLMIFKERNKCKKKKSEGLLNCCKVQMTDILIQEIKTS